LQTVVEQGEIVRLRAAPDQTISLQTGDGVLAVLQVPLVLQNRVVGLLSVDRQRTRTSFGQHDEEILAILADYAVLVLEKNRQFGSATNLSPRG
jgi:GAF domain-containing protein